MSRLRTYLNLSSLKKKILLLICGIAVLTPMALTTLLTFVYYYLGIESIFSKQIHDSFDEVANVSRLYLDEHINSIRADILSVANDIEHNITQFPTDHYALSQFLIHRANALSLSEALILNQNVIIAQTSLGPSILFEQPPLEAMEKAKSGEVYIEKVENSSKVRAVMLLQNFYDDKLGGQMYLLISRYIDPEIIQHIENTERSVSLYNNLKQNIVRNRYVVISAFVLLTLLLWVLAVLLAKKMTNIILEPIKQLVDATAKIRQGDYNIRVEEIDGQDEARLLARAFNKMIATIAKQHSELVVASQAIDDRRCFIETILSELSAGVLVTDKDRRITLYNISAVIFLNAKDGEILDNTLLSDIFPEADEAIQLLLQDREAAKTDMYIEFRRGQHQRHFFIKIGVIFEADKNYTKGKQIPKTIIITFDDITELISAQRFQAWADIAQRVAHEIKNPLTPIRLAAERLQTKFANQIVAYKDQFARYLDIINRKVDDMHGMLAEFIEFAKISTPQIKREDICSIIKDAILLEEDAHPNIVYGLHTNSNACYVDCDRRQLNQVFTNLLKNAAEAILGKVEGSTSPTILVKIERGDHSVKIIISDNGPGILDEILSKACEPYATTKAYGMGVGLCVVKKIVEEHGGKFMIYNNQDMGASASFTLPI